MLFKALLIEELSNYPQKSSRFGNIAIPELHLTKNFYKIISIKLELYYQIDTEMISNYRDIKT